MTVRAGALLGTTARAAGTAFTGAWRRVGEGLWPVLQQTGAATLSWWIARHVVDHHQPIFAPITTLVALNAARGERGSNAVRFVLGVIAGVLVAQLAINVLGHGYVTLAAATLVSMLIALAVGGERVTLAQAAVSAILAIAVGGPQNGPARATDALLGGGVALVFSQVLFPSEPIALLRRAETAALKGLADALRLTARALANERGGFNDWTWGHVRDAYTELAALSDIRYRTGTAAHRSPPWWGQGKLIVRESAHAAWLDLLGNSCLTLTRTSRSLALDDRQVLTPFVSELAGTLERLAAAPGDRDVRQREAERAIALAGRVPSPGVAGHAEFAVACTTVRMVARDLLLFTGIGEDTADRVVREGKGCVRVSAPPVMRRTPFRAWWRHGR
ncbi:FUSC family protein [Streptomyces reniochalinae]|uniref:Aromatic acid exporter family protein n=1 Tax=Streptomyces reniochalinae TaxID=2250578 RepID=A0A367E5G0_9ACTN|nr:FUSC family protein [Streptomyces reniochalinae]RCG13288.1 aromatic acid exporter family protein [Streptomyces reniochalinae]